MSPTAAASDGAGASPEFRADVALRLAVPMSDLVLVLDRDGLVRSVSGARSSSIAQQAVDWKGRRWTDLVARDEREAARALVQEARAEGVSQVRPLAHTPSPGLEWTIECCVAAVGETDGALVMGRDLRGISTLEARLAELQQTLERDYLRMRQAESRYRLLFGTARDAMLLIEPETLRITDANAAAEQRFGVTPGGLTGRELAACFEPEARGRVEEALRSTRVTGAVSELRARLVSNGGLQRLSVMASRADDAMLLTVRGDGETDGPDGGAAEPSFGALIEGLPSAVLLGDEAGIVRLANPAFAALARLDRPDEAIGRALSDFIAGPSGALEAQLVTLRSEGRIDDTPVLVRPAHGASTWALLSAARIAPGDAPWVAFMLRTVAQAAEDVPASLTEVGTDDEDLSSLLGRVSLTRLVRDTTTRVERGFLDAALARAAGNRTTAAELLGISRQSLYTKLRRHRLFDDTTGEEGEA